MQRLLSFWSGQKTDPICFFTPSQLNFTCKHDPDFMQSLNLARIVKYCEFKNIAFIPPVGPDKSIFKLIAESHDAQPSLNRTESVYCQPVLEGLMHFLEALALKQTFKAQVLDKDAYQIFYKAYRSLLVNSQGLDNFLATYLEWVERFSVDLKEKTPEECLNDLDNFEKKELTYIIENYDAAALLYVAELYHCFANTLYAKCMEHKEAKPKFNEMLQRCHKKISDCLNSGLGYLNLYKEFSGSIDPRSAKSMRLFNENMSGLTLDDTLLKLRQRLESLQKSNQVCIIPLQVPLGNKAVVDVDLARLPWPDRAVEVSVNCPPPPPPPRILVHPPREERAPTPPPRVDSLEPTDLTSILRRALDARRNVIKESSAPPSPKW